MNRTEQSNDLSILASEFLKYKKIAFKSLSAINVKQSNIVIGYVDMAGKNKWAEYNMSYLFSLVFHQAREPQQEIETLKEEIQGVNKRVDDLISTIEAPRKD